MGNNEQTERDLGRLEGALGGVRDALQSLVSRFDRLDEDVDRRILEAKKEAEEARDSATKAHARISSVEKRMAFYIGIGTAAVYILTNAGSIWETVRAVTQVAA